MQPDYGFNISGIQQVGVGTENFRKSWNWFIRMFGTDVKILEDDTVVHAWHGGPKMTQIQGLGSRGMSGRKAYGSLLCLTRTKKGEPWDTGNT